MSATWLASSRFRAGWYSRKWRSRKTPSAPDFVGLGVIGDGAVFSDGSSRVPKFRTWVAERQKERAVVLKQNRLYAEEVRGKGKGKDKNKKGKDKPQTPQAGADS